MENEFFETASDEKQSIFDATLGKFFDESDLMGAFMIMIGANGDCKPVMYGPVEMYIKLPSLLREVADKIDSNIIND